MKMIAVFKDAGQPAGTDTMAVPDQDTRREDASRQNAVGLAMDTSKLVDCRNRLLTLTNQEEIHDEHLCH